MTDFLILWPQTCGNNNTNTYKEEKRKKINGISFFLSAFKNMTKKKNKENNENYWVTLQKIPFPPAKKKRRKNTENKKRNVE